MAPGPLNKVIQMGSSPPNIKVLVAAGVPIPEAVKACLGRRMNKLARANRIARTAFSNCIHGRQRHDRVRAILAAELQVEREWLDEQLDALMAKRRVA